MNELRLFVSVARVKRRLAEVVLAIMAVSAIGLIVEIQPAHAQRHPAVNELARVGVYLAYYDQVNRIGVAWNQLSAADADARLRSKAAELYNRSFTQGEFDQMVRQHQQASNAYFAQVEQEVNASARWPRGMSAEAGRFAAKGMLEKGRRDYQSAVAARHDPLQALMIAMVVRGLAMGYETPPASIDVFGNQWQRITNSMPSPASRAVMAKLVSATQVASAQKSAQPGVQEASAPGQLEGRLSPPPAIAPGVRPASPEIGLTAPPPASPAATGRSWLGINILTGVPVVGVQENSPAGKAGLRSGDVITAINGQKVETANQIVGYVAQSAPGTIVTFTILRNNVSQELRVVLEEFRGQR